MFQFFIYFRQIEVIPNVKRRVNSYIQAIKATTMRRRANWIIEGYWTTDEQNTLTLKKVKNQPQNSVVTDADISNILRKYLLLFKTSAKLSKDHHASRDSHPT